MAIKHLEEYRNPDISRGLLDRIEKTSRKRIRLMEVCGTHTVSIFRSGIRTLLPDTISLFSGPGCPVCVTSQSEIDTFIQIARVNDVIVATFGDLMRVPGSSSSLRKEHAEGSDIRIVYSAVDALDIARKNPDKRVVFLGVGFETTAPTIAASIVSAERMGLDNFFLYSAHKLVPPALFNLMSNSAIRIDGFILPGHVSVIIGKKGYSAFFKKHLIPCVIAGFEPVDILQAISILVTQIEEGKPALVNSYKRAVKDNGNEKAMDVMYDVFETEDANWRGLGTIKDSGLKIRDKYKKHDAGEVFDIKIVHSEEPRGCACGEILAGTKIPPDCPLYKKSCTPIDPIGPCMVSSEGTCAAYYRYYKERA